MGSRPALAHRLCPQNFVRRTPHHGCHGPRGHDDLRAGWLAGWAVSSLLERHASDVVRAWITLTVVVLTLSILPIFALRASNDTRLALTALHCLAAAILTAGLPQPR